MSLSALRFGAFTVDKKSVKQLLTSRQYTAFRQGILGKPNKQANELLVRALEDADIHISLKAARGRYRSKTLEAWFLNAKGKPVLTALTFHPQSEGDAKAIPLQALAQALSEMGKRYAYLKQTLAGARIEEIRPILRHLDKTPWFVEA